jgi:hypothetical protein
MFYTIFFLFSHLHTLPLPIVFISLPFCLWMKTFRSSAMLRNVGLL